MPLPDFTTTIAVDSAHLPELAAAWPTWAKWRPEVMRNRILLVVDNDHDPKYINDLNVLIPVWQSSMPSIDLMAICYAPSNADWPQRERMLTGLVAAVEHVTTPFYLKLDTDTIAAGTGPDGRWWEDGWFEGGESGPVLTASAWGYSKPSSMLDQLDVWADEGCSVSITDKDAARIAYGDRPPRTITGNIAKHPRIISYAMWGRTDWTRRIWRLCNGRLPCPSQDTFLGYCAVRGAWPIIRVNQKKFGWQHCGSSLKRVRERARAAILDFNRPERLGFTFEDYRREYTSRYPDNGPSESSDCGGENVGGHFECGCWVCRSIEWGLGRSAT